jgi:transcription initiation factor TFIID subunit 5
MSNISEEAIKKYLKDKGYTKSLKIFEEEEKFTNKTELKSNITKYKENLEISNEIDLFSNEELIKQDNNLKKGKKISLSYQNLTKWVYSSLDLYKDELIQVLYPIFLHCYLEVSYFFNIFLDCKDQR